MVAASTGLFIQINKEATSRPPLQPRITFNSSPGPVHVTRQRQNDKRVNIQNDVITPLPDKVGISPSRRGEILRGRYFQYEALCLAGGPGLDTDMGPSRYLAEIFDSTARHPDLHAVLLDWLAAPLSKPWHFHVCDRNERLYLVNDALHVAHSSHPELSAMRRLQRFALTVPRGSELQAAAEAAVEIKEAAMHALDWRDWADEDGVKGEASEQVKLEIQSQATRLITYLQQYIARIGITHR